MRSISIVLLVTFAACGGGGGDDNSGPKPDPVPQLGDPNPGLAAEMLTFFERGRKVFNRRFKQSEGHGPDFNTSSCKSCHSTPAAGGSSPLYRNFLIVAETVNNAMAPVLDDDVLVARNFSYVRVMRETIPANADIVAQRNSPAMFGLGLLASIDDFDVTANHDPADADGDGISGRVNLDFGELGRFGYKAQESDLVDFVRGPIFNHMGITTDPLTVPPGAGFTAIPQVGSPNDSTTDNDGTADPELSNDDLFALVTFVRELAPPAPLPMDAAATAGEQHFDTALCAKCHIPNIVRVGDPIVAYTDLLLHDMGPALADGVLMGLAGPTEFRTQPLWGLRHHAPYMHDGRADTVEDAILAHDGEAEESRDAFTALTRAQRDELLRFLETR